LFILIKMTDAQLVSRRARVQQLIADGRVMTDSMRKKQKEVAKYQEQLETLADRILSGLL
jgi:16S rRNA U516 pseudouridylate synthase RsuA-like enzyme